MPAVRALANSADKLRANVQQPQGPSQYAGALAKGERRGAFPGAAPRGKVCRGPIPGAVLALQPAL